MRGYSASVDAASGPWPARHALANRTATAPGCGRARRDVGYGEASALGSCKRDGRQKGDGWESERDLPGSLMDDSGGAVERRGRLVQRRVAGVDDRNAHAVKMFRRRWRSPPPSARLRIG